VGNRIWPTCNIFTFFKERLTYCTRGSNIIPEGVPRYKAIQSDDIRTLYATIHVEVPCFAFVKLYVRKFVRKGYSTIGLLDWKGSRYT